MTHTTSIVPSLIETINYEHNPFKRCRSNKSTFAPFLKSVGGVVCCLGMLKIDPCQKLEMLPLLPM